MASGDIILSGGTTVTPEDLQKIAAEVEKIISTNSKDPGEWEEVTSLQGVTSMPVFHQMGTAYKLVRVAVATLQGASGREVELQVNAEKTKLEWRYVGQQAWITLIDMSLLKGAPGDTPEFRYGETGLEWKYTTASEWNTLVPVDDLRFHFDDLTTEQIAALWRELPDDVKAEFQAPATEAAAQADAATERANAAAEAAEQTNASVIGQEEARVEAEQGRAAAEAERVQDEAARAATEAERTTAESARAESEAERQSAESARQDAEAARTSAEEARATAEDVRASAEQERATAESARDSAETTRQENEVQRVLIESDRVEAEAERAAQEEGRATAEQDRATAETARISAEADRAAQESTRQQNEASRAGAEADRQAAEEARDAAEQDRTTAEVGRASAEAIRQQQEETRQTGTAEAVRSMQEATDTAVSTMQEATAQAISAAGEATEAANRATEAATGAAALATDAAASIYTPDIDHEPGEADLTYRVGEVEHQFRPGDECRYFDPERGEAGEYVFYKLHDITAEGKAVWKKAGSGAGGDMETAHVVLSCEDGQNDRLVGISISIRHGITLQEQAYDGVGLTFQVPVNAQYTVSVGTLDDFDTPPAQTFIAEGTKTREISFTYFFPRYGKIRFALANGTAGNITGDVDQNFYRRATRLCRRCVVESQDTSGVHIRFLHDANSYQYADGTPAALDGKPVMVYLPECWVMCTLSEDQTLVDVEISSELKAGWQHFPESLVGAFKMGEAAVSSPNTTMKTGLTWDEAAQACWDIGEGWQLVDYRQHCLVALLLYGRYGTRNIRSVIGSNKEYTGALTQTGETMTTGIQDTTPESVRNFTNCLGLEAWTGYMQEWMAGVSVQEGSWFLFGENDEVREVPAALSTGWITRMAFERGGHFDLIPIETGMSGSNTTGYTEFSEAVNAPLLELGVMRANFTYNEAPDDGIARVSATLPMQVKGKFCGARAAYYGNIIKEE